MEVHGVRVAVITVAGISSRFNEGIEEDKRCLKAIYAERDETDTLLFHLTRKCSYADKIIMVGGYKYADLERYATVRLPENIRKKLVMVYNGHYCDLASGYSLYLGLREAFRCGANEIVFVEGDLDIDDESFRTVVDSERSVLTYTSEPIYADKAVILYRDNKEQYRYAFNESHGLLSIGSPFSCILNSGQTWKFTEMTALRRANERFYNETKDGTNLRIIQNYLDDGVEVSLIGLKRWINCNTREDYRKIAAYWEEER